MSDLKHHFVTANNIRIHVVEQGTGPLVLLLHGFPELWYSWRHQLPALAEAGYRAVAIDQRGYGRSFKPGDWREYQISRLVADAVGVVQALGEQQAVIVGHDWGAPVAWTSAWMRDDIFRAVVGISVPFSGRGLVALPGNPFGEVRPSITHQEIAGPMQDFYQDYFGTPACITEAEADVRSWYRDVVYSLSGDALAPHLKNFDPSDAEALTSMMRASPACIPHGSRMCDRFMTPETPPDWFTEKDLDCFVDEFERTGFVGGWGYYRSMDLSWEGLAPMYGKPLTVPALFIGGEFDSPTLWGWEAIRRAGEHIPQYAGSKIIPGSGHWIQQEKPAETNNYLLDFLSRLD
jgi:pimeloyl-ACP methyl ester carboxylesterase